MKYTLPRVILGNRGDLASRWGIILALNNLIPEEYTVFRDQVNDVPLDTTKNLAYGQFRNLILSYRGLKKLIRGSVVLWTVGLDLQDDSSLLKLPYLLIKFYTYRIFGNRIICLFQ